MKTFLKFTLLFFTIALNNLSQTWQNIGPGAGSDLKSIAIHPENPDIVYIGGDIEGIFKTTNGGQTWQNVNGNLVKDYSTPDVYWVQEIVFDPSDQSYQTLYSCTTIGLFRTTNGGDTWEMVFPKSPETEEDFSNISFLTVDPGNSNKLWMGSGTSYANEDGNGKIYKSEDKGATWEEMQVASGSGVIHGIFIDPQSPAENRTIYVSSSDGLYKSEDNGLTWVEKNNGLPHTNLRRLNGVVKDNSLALYLTITTLFTENDPNSFKGGIFKSDDNAESWTDITGNLPRYQEDESKFYFYWKFSFNPANPDIIYTATTRGWPDEGFAGWEEWGIYKTTNGGTSWEKISNDVEFGWLGPPFYEEDNAFILEVAPSDPNTIYWGIDWMNKTTDGGSSWQQLYTTKKGDHWEGNGLELMVVDGISFDPNNSNTLYVGYDDFGLFRSDDGGVSFKPLDPKQDPYDGSDGAKEVTVDPDNGDVFISRYDGLANALGSNYSIGEVWKSTDRGENWDNFSNGLPQGYPKLIMDKSSGSAGSRTLYCSIIGHGIYKSVNGENSWTQINTGLGNDSGRVWEIEIHPTNSQVLYAGINSFGAGGSLYKSEDAGNSWSKVSAFPAMDILEIKIDPSNGYVYVGATDNFDYNFEGGLYVSKDDGNSWNKILNDSRIAGIVIHPNNSEKIYTISQAWYLWNSTINPGVFVTEDGGNNWADITGSLGNTFLRTIEINPFNPDEIYVGTDGGGLWKLNSTTTTVEQITEIPNDFKLFQNYPNPFNPTTTIAYVIPSGVEESKVKLIIYDILGNEIATLLNESKPAGTHEIEFDASTLSSGVYYYQLIVGRHKEVKKMVLMK